MPGDRAQFSRWPGADRRAPGRAHYARLVLRPLSQAIERAVAREIAPAGGGQAVLDVGCGAKPYFPFFAGHAREYIGFDSAPGPQVDVVGAADSLPFDDGRFDAVLCTQTLEHVPDPAGSVREMHRVLRPGGVLLLSVPSTGVYHPLPQDFWRWTQEGLVKLVRDNGEWSGVELTPAGGTAACFGYLIGTLVHGALGARWQRPLHDLVLAIVNAAFGALDAVVPLHYPRRYTLISSFLAVARKRRLSGRTPLPRVSSSVRRT